MSDERDRERALIVRDHLLCVLEDAGAPLAPRELASRAGRGPQAVVMHARRWPAYFEVEEEYQEGKNQRAVRIGRHRHLTGAA